MNKARREQLSALSSQLEEVKSQLESLQAEEQEYYDNMPPSIQAGERGDIAQENANSLESGATALQTSIDSIEEAMQCLQDGQQ